MNAPLVAIDTRDPVVIQVAANIRSQMWFTFLRLLEEPIYDVCCGVPQVGYYTGENCCERFKGRPKTLDECIDEVKSMIRSKEESL